MDKIKPITVNEVLLWLTGINLRDAQDALVERIRELGRQAILAVEKLEQNEKIMRSDPVLGLLLAVCDGDTESLKQLVGKYQIHRRSLSYLERNQVEQQLKRNDILSIAHSSVLIWLGTYPFSSRGYFSLPQERRERILANIISRECRRHLLGEISNPRRNVPLEQEEYHLGVHDAETEDATLDFSKLDLDINTLTTKEIALLHDALNAMNQGVEVGSKKGLSLQQYWGKDYVKNIKMLQRIKAKRRKTQLVGF